MSKLKGPDGRIPDRLPDGRPAVAWERRWTEGTLPLWLIATAGGMAVIFVLGIFFYGSYNGCLLYTSPSPRDRQKSRMPSSA